MVFKQNWEKTGSHTHIEDSTIRALVSHALPADTLDSYAIISGGCINSNIKLIFTTREHPLMLRVYLRDQDCAYSEKKLAALLHGTLPVPMVYSIHDFAGYRYAIVEYIPGITMRELLLEKPNEDAASVVHEAGKLIGTMQKYHFEQAGFFDKDLKVVQLTTPYDYVAFMEQCLTKPSILNTLDAATLEIIKNFVTKHPSLLPKNSQHNLVHGDYDPANILVQKIAGKWHISAILDWEFAFSGSWLWDVSNMLRYSHEVPAWYETSFLQGLEDTGLQMPSNWRQSINMLNLLSLLDILARNPANERPCQQTDIVALINHIVSTVA
jgi:aminoglycoside phosphotransferase (APT) family kinase protein